MSHPFGPEGTNPVSTPDPVRVTVDLPPQVVRDCDGLVAGGVHLSLGEAIRHAVVSAWRVDRGAFHTLRVDLRRDAKADDGGGSAPEPGGER